MSHITTGVEYGLHCLLYLIDKEGHGPTATVRDLAELQELPFEFVAKLFTKLQKARLVEATEGARGGFRLARKPSQISVLDVVIAIDGDKPLFDCREIRGNCILFQGKPAAWATRGVCAIHAVMLEAEGRMREALSSHTINDIALQVSAKAPARFWTDLEAWLKRARPEKQAVPKRASKKAKAHSL
jgi:Rrf2 family protein